MLFSLVFVAGLFMAWFAHAAGLAPIIGAFAAGLLFEPIFLKEVERQNWFRILSHYYQKRRLTQPNMQRSTKCFYVTPTISMNT